MQKLPELPLPPELDPFELQPTKLKHAKIKIIIRYFRFWLKVFIIPSLLKIWIKVYGAFQKLSKVFYSLLIICHSRKRGNSKDISIASGFPLLWEWQRSLNWNLKGTKFKYKNTIESFFLSFHHNYGLEHQIKRPKSESHCRPLFFPHNELVLLLELPELELLLHPTKTKLKNTINTRYFLYLLESIILTSLWFQGLKITLSYFFNSSLYYCSGAKSVKTAKSNFYIC